MKLSYLLEQMKKTIYRMRKLGRFLINLVLFIDVRVSNLMVRRGS